MGVSSPDFRAPPPSPVASSRRASFTANEDVLSEFLDKCGRVPNLVLPDKVFPKHRFLLKPPSFDFLRLRSQSALLLDAISTIGCFQLTNHGVPESTVRAAMAAADQSISQDDTEELVLYKDDIADQQTERPAYYSHLRELMGEAERIGKTMREMLGVRSQQEEGVGVCYVKKHNSKNESKGFEEEEAIRLLIRGYDEKHSLCLSFCHAEFHVYSKRGWVSFFPSPDAVVVTVGDQGWSGRFKAVVGRPLCLYRSDHASLPHHFLSISFLYATLSTTTTLHNNNNNHLRITQQKKKKTISFSQQLLFALFLTLLFPFFLP
ncbi:hypothetical protein EUTSA_v10018887mg [Eutrema salsugineum]|uniref:Non-haem dioxygenase N-terminal domain-containing protein n=1 Tax=Eutrema salsugineum TaxID=72664 RepID=V4KBD2_EUTSA|nr:uncharacterized protein LOC18008990 [Eutrema salsugineum]ESQ27017.1 hypothetical protein EUTSA_v10018887mg [Eutrema salsugineum]